MVRDRNAINAGSHVVEQPFPGCALFESRLIWALAVIVRGWSMGMEVKLPPPMMTSSSGLRLTAEIRTTGSEPGNQTRQVESSHNVRISITLQTKS
jgi:hypothetical protein